MQNETASAGHILGRLKRWLDAKTDVELASAIGVSPSTLSSWRQRDAIPYSFCVDFALERGVGLDWLILGVGGDAPIDVMSPADQLDVQAIELAIVEVGGATAFLILDAHQIAPQLAEKYRKFAEILKNARELGVTRDQMFEVIRKATAKGSNKITETLIDSAKRKKRPQKGPQSDSHVAKQLIQKKKK